jgi:sulfotransferase
MSGPLYHIFSGLRRNMSEIGEFAHAISDEQRELVLRAAVEAFYSRSCEAEVVFDTNRGWCATLPAIARVFPDSKMICCLRNTAWILDSFERIVQTNSLRVSKMFPADGSGARESGGNVVERVEHLMRNQVGWCLNSLREAWFGDHAERLIGIRYESFVEQPGETVRRLYELLGEEPFPHDFESLQYDEPMFDEFLGLPGLHRVRQRVEAKPRQSILPPDLFAQHNRSFWDMPGQNPRKVPLL